MEQAPRFLAQIPSKFRPLLYPRRYKILWGGRGSAKSWSVARALVGIAHRYKHRIGCFRELQASIAESVHQLLKDQIYLLGLQDYFRITESSIVSLATGSEFLFKGLRHNAAEIKSMEGITIAWIEEGQLVTKDSWEILIPTIRKVVDTTRGPIDSEIWVTFNPVNEDDDTYRRFVSNPSPDAWVCNCSYRDNPFFTATLEKERQWLQRSDIDAYNHIYEGQFLKISQAIVFAGKYTVDTFDDPPRTTRLNYGADFGFSQDPTTLIRNWITGEPPNEELWMSHEAYGVGVEIDETPELFDSVPGARENKIWADGSRPETISYIRRQGFNIEAADKWPGCEEDGIQHIKAFREVHLHQRMKHTLQEARLYSYKRDRVTGEILPILIDKNNHCWDATRYSLNGVIQNRGGLGVWLKL
jgi:phage terminase large subunit